MSALAAHMPMHSCCRDADTLSEVRRLAFASDHMLSVAMTWSWQPSAVFMTSRITFARHLRTALLGCQNHNRVPVCWLCLPHMITMGSTSWTAVNLCCLFE